MKKTSIQKGFTLTEVLVTLGITGVLMALALPSLESYVAGQKVKRAAADVAHTMVLARSEALKRSCRVTIKPVSSTPDWSAGWEAEDISSNILVVHGEQSGLSIVASEAQPYLFPHGRPVRPFSVTVQHTRATGENAARCVQMTTTGMVMTKRGTCA